MSERGPLFTVIAEIAEALAPVARGAKYEDPLDLALQGAGLGRVSGGGSLLGLQRRIASMDIELVLRNLEDALQFARATLLSLGAPAGSLLLFLRDGRPRALAVATGEEFEHQPAMDALARRLAVPQVGDGDEERERVEAAARKTLQHFESLWTGSHDRPPADLAAYSADWLRWYDEVARVLASHGLRFVGDIATVRTDLPIPKSLGFSRKFLATDGITRADAFQMAAAEPNPPRQMLVLKSEFEDGGYLATSNVRLTWNVPDFIDDERLPADSSAEVIVRCHAARLAAHASVNAAAALRLTSLADLLASEDRERSRTRRFRQEQRIPSRVELERLGAAPEFAARVHAEMRRLKGESHRERP
ncbi:MAG TPA: hypothetical protein VGN43_09975 [Steroidobacteraceae bacterium]|jgi:hypothetical protein|nr:hypothetical protein [Steroidobacteraceae bacterium]